MMDDTTTTPTPEVETPAVEPTEPTVTDAPAEEPKAE
jgi:hypothetical protein